MKRIRTTASCRGNARRTLAHSTFQFPPHPGWMNVTATFGSRRCSVSWTTRSYFAWRSSPPTNKIRTRLPAVSTDAASSAERSKYRSRSCLTRAAAPS